jgi:hypothetical protein
MAEVLALRDGGAMAEQRHTRSLVRLMRDSGDVFVLGRGYGLAGVGWALTLVGGWSATLTSQRANGR